MAITFKRDEKGRLIAYKDGQPVGAIMETGSASGQKAPASGKKKK